MWLRKLGDAEPAAYRAPFRSADHRVCGAGLEASTRLRCDRIHRDAAVEAWEGRGREVELGTVEGSEKSVARGVSPRVRESAEFLSQQVVVGAEQFVPSMVAELSSALCRSHDIGEHNPEASREYLGYSLDQIASLEREGVLLRRRPLKNCEV